MSLMVSLIGGDVSADAVTIPTASFTRFRIDGPCYSGVKFDSDGDCYRRQADGGWSSIGTWLLKGTATNYYLYRNIDSGTLTNDAGDGVQLGTDRVYDVLDSTPSGETSAAATVSFIISTGSGLTFATATPINSGPTAQIYSASYIAE